MFPPDPLEPRAIENMPGRVFDAAKLSNYYAEDINDLTSHVVQIEEYLLTEPWGGGGGTPGGNDTEIQFNDEGSFAGCPAIVYDKATKKATIQNTVTITPSGGIDAYVKLMLHFNGDNDGTVFTDDSTNDYTAELFGSPVIKTGTKKFGSAAGYFDGSSYLEEPDSADWDFGSGDFTIDWWEYRTSNPQYSSAMARDNTAYTAFLLNLSTSGGEQQVYMSGNGTSWDIANGKSFGSNTLNEWVHYAVVRSGNTFYTFQNGVQKDTWTSSVSLGASSLPLRIGKVQDFVTEYFNGYLDEIRVSKGIARWTANFTPPTSEYTGDAYEEEEIIIHSEDSVEENVKGEHTFGISGGKTIIEAGYANFKDLPTSDPLKEGQLWSDGGILAVSSG